jgi:hypothetical protein
MKYRTLSLDVKRIIEANDLEEIKWVKWHKTPGYGKKHKSIVHLVVKHSTNVKVLAYFVKKWKSLVNQRCRYSRKTPLFYACVLGKLNFVRFLVEKHNARIDVSDRRKISPLMMSVQRNN